MRKTSLPNTPERDGTEFDKAIKERLEKPYPIELPVYTVQALEALTAKNYEGHIVRCSNGNAGAECLAYCNGRRWKMIPVDNYISLTESGFAVSDVAYDAGTWDGVTTIAPSKNAVRDKFVTVDTAVALRALAGANSDITSLAGLGASTLDDYEVGDWTPVIADASSGGNVGTGTMLGKYAKVGDIVIIGYIIADLSTAGMTAGNDFYVRGLPFTLGSSVHSVGSITGNLITFAGFISTIAPASSTYFRIVETSSGSNLDYVIVSELVSGSADLYGTLVYQV